MTPSATRAVIPRGQARAKSEPDAPQPSTDINREPPGLRFAPDAVFLLQKGVDSMANAVRPTLGPTPRIVAIAPFYGTGRPPELLDDAATIVRRIVEVPDPYVNMGAMLARQVLWSVHEKAGDGGATAAVLMQSMVREGLHRAAAGWNVMRMRLGIERGLEQVHTTLRAMAHPVETEADVFGLALAASADKDLAKRLGEIFDTLGADGHVEVHDQYVPGMRHEYIEGGYWKSGWVSALMATNELQSEARLVDPYILVARGDISSHEDLTPILNAVAAQSASLMVIALNVTGTALALLLSNKDKVPSVAVKSPDWGENMENNLKDIAVLTGTRVILNNMGESVRDVALQDLGRARIVTVNKDYFGLVGGLGDAKQIRQHIADVRNMLKNSDGLESDEVTRLRARLGKLTGGVAVIYVGAGSPSESQARMAEVERAVNTVKHAELGGIVPGGGTAYVQCIRDLRKLKLPEDQAVGIDVLARALEEPLRAIASNGGYEASAIAAKAHGQKPGWGFNALTGTFEDLWAAGVVDPLPVVETALDMAVSGALMALTTSVSVHRKKPPMTTEP